MFSLQNVVKKFTTRAVLKDEKTDIIPFPNFFEFNDVRVFLYDEVKLDTKIALTRHFKMLISLMKVV